MPRTRGIFSWVATSVLTVVSAVGIVAMTTGNLASSSAASATTASAATAATTAAVPVHVTSGTVSYHDDSNTTGN